jgi:adenylate kinase
LSAGDLLRQIANQPGELGRKVNQTVNVEGRLVPPELISELIRRRVEAVPKNQGLVLDGYPRNLEQYELFKKFWPGTGRGDYHVGFIDVSEEEAIRRLSKRVACKNCGTLYAEGSTAKCANCGGRLLRRPDDTPVAIQTRLELFKSETVPMIRAMEASGKVFHIDGARPVDEVHREILSKS